MSMIAAPIMWPADTVPSNALVLDGSEIEIALYPALYAAFGRIYTPPEADPAKFRLPDYRGYALRGVDMGSGHDPDAKNVYLGSGKLDRIGRSARGDGTAGDEVGTTQIDSWKDHEHLAIGGDGESNSTAVAIAKSDVSTGVYLVDQPKTSANIGAAAETRCDNIALTFITFYQ